MAMRFLLGLTVVTGLMMGCQSESATRSTVPGPRTASLDLVSPEHCPQVLLRDGLHEQLVLLGEPDVKAPADGKPLSVRVRLRSVTDQYLPIRYRFRFYGADREVLTPDPVWYPAEIAPTHDRTFEAGALQMIAAQWEPEVARR